jgi:hypothetical protein
MATEKSDIQDLIDKLEGLPPERIAEVEDFVDFLRHGDTDRELTRAAGRVAGRGLQKVWDNPDDAAYDAL